jgi:arsenite methyltransferase
MAAKLDYGIDAPTVIRNLFISSAVCIVLALVVRGVTLGFVRIEFFPGMLYTAVFLAAPAVLMLVYAKSGKFRHRDQMLAKIKWTGAESVLDVGAGRGLLLIGAAKRLTTGHATGIDIWNAKDLSGNGPEGLRSNIAIEGVGGKTTVQSEDARLMSFADASFDVVLSNLCLHNISARSGREKACAEIARVLKPGGVAVISDYKLTAEYSRVLGKRGLIVDIWPLDWSGTFPPMRILVARKPA